MDEVLGEADGILVPGGFGVSAASRARSRAARYARANKIPYLGICLGLQVAVCEFARDVVRLGGRPFRPSSARPPRTRSST